MPKSRTETKCNIYDSNLHVFCEKPLLVNAFFNSQFEYCQCAWMCYNRTNNSKINRLHERCLRLIYNDKKPSFEDLLEKEGSVSIDHRSLRTLAVELFKVFKGSNPVTFVCMYVKFI